MSGTNRYLEVRSQYRNLHEAFEKRASFATAAVKRDPCVFLSHRSTDKAAVLQIGDYIMKKGIDVYIDVDDPDLQQAVTKNDHKAITAAIELGISKSTDLMAYLTPNTQTSVWVPYEIGFAKRAGNELSAMKSKDLTALPSYLEVVHNITGIDSLNEYLKGVHSRQQTAVKSANPWHFPTTLLLETASVRHPLATYLSQS